ncbi:MAG: hypothetical protein P9M11_00560 [Candidatus Tenebribacter burtonii]|jgi:hypothetical protein|nr:hypothetical protein [Candidatus Tenebribacter burtonii]
MKKNLLVTLTDANYIEQAKQLFSSVYWNSGWKGNYMLLAHDVPDEKLIWFSEKEIIVERCSAFSDIKFRRLTAAISKLLLFKSKFKEVYTEMQERQGGVSSISGYRSIYYMIKVLLSILLTFSRAKII